MVAEKDQKTTKMSKYDKDVYINFHLEGETKVMFIDIKDFYNLRYNMEIFRLIVKNEHKKLFPEKHK